MSYQCGIAKLIYQAYMIAQNVFETIWSMSIHFSRFKHVDESKPPTQRCSEGLQSQLFQLKAKKWLDKYHPS